MTQPITLISQALLDINAREAGEPVAPDDANEAFATAYFTYTLTGAATVVHQYTTLLNFQSWKTNNATALAVSYDQGMIYGEYGV